MPEGKLCNRKLVDSKEFLDALLTDKSGQQYYEEMNQLDVDASKLWATIQKSFKSRMKTWLEICAHCGLCADSCFFYLANNRDPKQVPSYKIQSTLGEMIKRKGKVDNSFMQMTMDTAWSKCSCCNRCGMYCPFGIDMGIMFGYLRGLCFSQGFVPWELKIGTGMHRIYHAQMDVTTEDWVDTCNWMAEENEE
ncbi:MAG: 4Fe-4S dicluster domain-containing protein, partial [Desulfobacterales bacterium]|nr:4Fe-4S dicluster domain-containing protein [Desulfobacterales bacterium]